MQPHFRTLTASLILGFCLLLALSGCSLFASQSTAQPQATAASNSGQSAPPMAEGRLVPNDSAWLSFNSNGKVAEVMVEEGQQVAAGQALARMGDLEGIEANLKAALQAELEAKQALDTLNEYSSLVTTQAWQALLAARVTLMNAQEALDRLDTQSYQDKIGRAWDKVQTEKDDLDDAQKNFDKYKDLAEDNSTRQRAQDDLDTAQKNYDQAVREHDRLVNALDQAHAAVDQAQAAVDEADRHYQARRDGPDPDELAIAQARLANAQAQRSAAQVALDNATLRAPYAGEITSLKISAGEQMRAGDPAIQIADFSAWYVETTDLNELEVVNIQVGQSAILQPDALPGVELTGVVERIASAYVEKGGDILYTVHIRMDKLDERLRWGMTVAVIFAENK
jgi:multidrug resistance efflux pump